MHRIPTKHIVTGNGVHEAEKTIPVTGETDVIVAGGGMAGFGAAIGAARSGSRVLLIEAGSFLGGTGSGSLMTEFWINYDDAHGVVKEFVDRMLHYDGARKGQLIPCDPEAIKRTMFEMCEEARVSLLLYTSIVDAIIHESEIKGVVVENKSGRQAIMGKVVIDSTGDGDVMAWSGAEFVKGREEDGKMRPMSLLFRMGRVDLSRIVQYFRDNPKDFTPDPFRVFVDEQNDNMRFAGFFSLVEKAKRAGQLDEDIHYLRIEGIMPHQGTVVINTSRVYGYDGTDAMSKTHAELAARKQVSQLVSFLQKYVPGFQDSFLLQTSSSIGVRETRRLRGQYVMTKEDITEERRFAHPIASFVEYMPMGSDPNSIIHSPDAREGAEDDQAARELASEARRFWVPYEALLPTNVERLLVAGRCFSGTHGADAWCRNMPICMLMGQGAGIAAAVSIRTGIVPSKIEWAKLEAELWTQDVLIG